MSIIKISCDALIRCKFIAWLINLLSSGTARSEGRWFDGRLASAREAASSRRVY